MKNPDRESAIREEKMSEIFNAESWLNTAAPALGITVIDSHRAEVITNLNVAAQMADRLFAVTLEDDIDLAPIFCPEPPNVNE